MQNLSHPLITVIQALGQNVNSYRDGDYDFADLLSAVAQVDRNMRVRFTTSHPKDMSDKLIKTIAEQIHKLTQESDQQLDQLLQLKHNDAQAKLSNELFK